jgi:DHA1 family tetracycline resistance protein-like MFS transporter
MASDAAIASSDSAPAPPAAKSNRSAMMIVFFVVIIDLLGFGIVLPILPRTGEEYLLPIFEGADLKAVRGALVGILLSTFSAMQFLFAPMWGRISDRVGRRPVLLVGLGGSVLFYAMFGYAAGMPDRAALALCLMFVARTGAGFAGATIATAQAVIADCTPPEKRKHGMAMIGAAFGIAFTFGPMLGAIAMYFAPDDRSATSYSGYVSALLSAIALTLAVVLLPETKKPVGGPTALRRLFDHSAWRSALANSAIAPVIMTFFVATIGFAAFESTLALLIKDVLDLNKDKAYWLFAYVGFVLIMSQGFLYRRFAKKLTEVVLITAGIVLMSVGVIGLAGVSLLRSMDKEGFGALLAAMMIALAIAVIGFSFLTPSAQALISRRTSVDRQGEILGVNQSASALARIIGPIFGNTLYSLTDTHMLPYLFGGGLLLAMLLLIPRVRRA